MSESGGTTLTTTAPFAGATPVSAESGNVANAPAVATLPAAVGKTTYLTGFTVAALGATAGSTVDIAVTGAAATLHFSYSVPTGATLAQAPMVVMLPAPVAGAAPNTAVVVTLPALGAGNTNARVSAIGYQV
jgi:hypothetical protein